MIRYRISLIKRNKSIFFILVKVQQLGFILTLQKYNAAANLTLDSLQDFKYQIH